MPRDPADVARERSAKAVELIREAESLESNLPEDRHLIAASNLRLRAICEHLRIGTVPEGEPDGEQD